MSSPLPLPEPTFLAIEIGGTKLQVCAGTADGRILERRRFAIDRARGAAGIQKQIAACLPELIASAAPVAMGVGFGGPIDWRTGQVWRSYHLEGWSNFPLGSWLSDLSGVPVYADNDANVGAWGEARVRLASGSDHDPLFYTTLGSGVGGGLIVGGQIYHGAPPGELEFGHLRREKSDAVLQDECSGWAVDRRVRELAGEQPEGLLARSLQAEQGIGGESRHLGRALAEGDRQAVCILEEVVKPLSLALSHVIHLLHPKIIVLGGGLSDLGEPLRTALERSLVPLVMDVFQEQFQIVLSKLREDAVPVGALFLASTRHALATECPL